MAISSCYLMLGSIGAGYLLHILPTHEASYAPAFILFMQRPVLGAAASWGLVAVIVEKVCPAGAGGISQGRIYIIMERGSRLIT